MSSPYFPALHNALDGKCACAKVRKELRRLLRQLEYPRPRDGHGAGEFCHYCDCGKKAGHDKFCPIGRLTKLLKAKTPHLRSS